jgi:hypothetical protein
MEGHCMQAPPLWIFRMIRMKPKKKTESPNLVIWVTQRTEYWPKEPNIWLFGYLGHPNNQIWQFRSSKERNWIWQ